ncbi:MAG: hypothetical protein ACUVQI_06415 [Thermochromatium sp.]
MIANTIYTLSRGALFGLLLVTLPLTSAWATSRKEAEQAIAQAKAAHQQAVSAGVAADEAAALITQAESILPSRQYTKALQIAVQAKQQAESAYKQATSAKPVDGDLQQQAEASLAAAKAARQKAASVGGEWRDTGKLIAQAEALAKSGQYQQAIELANKARVQGELGYAQAIQEQDADFPAYIWDALAKP